MRCVLGYISLTALGCFVNIPALFCCGYMFEDITSSILYTVKPGQFSSRRTSVCFRGASARVSRRWVIVAIGAPDVPSG